MRQVIYTSRAAGGEGDLDAILGCSNNNNPELGITGVLIVIGDVYLQLIEGPRANVWALLDFIREDPRHSDMEVLVERPAPRRAFAGWAMAHHRIAPHVPADAEILAALDAAGRAPSPAAWDRLVDAVTAIERSVLRRHAA